MVVYVAQPSDQIYSHRDETGRWRIYNASAILRAIAAGVIKPTRIRFHIDDELYAHLSANAGIERAHLATLTPQRLEEPVLMLLCGDDERLVIDGNHRLVARYEAGKKVATALQLTEQQCEPYKHKD